jgi:site-specific recombinase XerC
MKDEEIVTNESNGDSPIGRNGRRLSKATAKGYRAGLKPPNAGKQFPAEILTQEEVRTLINTCSSKSATGIRNRALLVAMYRGGLRVSEALSLRPKDIDADEGTLTILHGKGDLRRTIGIDPGALAVISRWLERRERLGLNGRHPLFCTLAGEQMHSAYVRSLMPRLAKKAGIEKRVHRPGRADRVALLARVEPLRGRLPTATCVGRVIGRVIRRGVGEAARRDK